MFTSVYETPINAKKQAIASSEVSKQWCHTNMQQKSQLLGLDVSGIKKLFF